MCFSNEIKRGDIYYIDRADNYATESEQHSGRPAIVVSNDKNNAHSSVIEVVYLTTQPKTDLPTHVDIRSSKKNSIALCEQVYSVSVQRVNGYVSTCTEYEMQMVNAALMISLNLDYNAVDKVTESNIPTEVKSNNSVMEEDVRLRIERDTYKQMYESLLEKIVVK